MPPRQCVWRLQDHHGVRSVAVWHRVRVPGVWCGAVLFLAGLVLALGIADCRLLEARNTAFTPHHHAASLADPGSTFAESGCSHTDLDGATRCPHGDLRIDAVLTRTDETAHPPLAAADLLIGTDPAPMSRLRGPPHSSAVRADSGADLLLQNCICRR